ncbi:MAG: 23S rRNA (pseudouridine(1915)-N(3))-methyltransferase RlmH [Pseudomonadota bacterium]
MNIHVIAVGRIAARAPERLLIDDYSKRFLAHARQIGVRSLREHEVDPRKLSSKAAQAEALRKRVPVGSRIITLDERGTAMSSEDFATEISRARDASAADFSFLIGGAEGLEPALLAEADLRVCFGRMVWPHQLVRVMLYEQLYRSATILTGGPYHKA